MKVSDSGIDTELVKDLVYERSRVPGCLVDERISDRTTAMEIGTAALQLLRRSIDNVSARRKGYIHRCGDSSDIEKSITKRRVNRKRRTRFQTSARPLC